MSQDKNINDSRLQKVTDFTDAVNRLYSSRDSSTLDGYVLTKELIDYILGEVPGGGDMLKAVYDTNDSGVVDNSTLVNGDTVANDSAVQTNTSKVSYDDSGNVVLKTGETDQNIDGNLEVNGQAHGGNALHSFSASKTFDFDNGNIQEMPVSASTTISVDNLQVGTFILQLPITVGTSPVITIDGSLGTKYTTSADLVDANGDENTITVIKYPSGSVRYTISNIVA